MDQASRLVDILPGPGLVIAPHVAPASRRLRAEVHGRLQVAARSLEPGLQLLVLDAFRTQPQQFNGWNRRLIALARTHPDADLATLTELCRRDVADPVNKPSGHQSGAAVDITMLRDGREFDMGNTYGDFGTRGTAHDRVRTLCADLTPGQRANRAELSRVMVAAGFVNYPEEWWHFSYGDRLWAQISRFGHDDGARTEEQVGRDAYRFVAVIDSPLFDAKG